jgi:hypothetical protein
MSAAHPIPFEKLVALWAHDLPPEEAHAIEEHLFACEACDAASDRLGRLVGGLRDAIPPVISAAHRDRLAARGVRIRFTPCDVGAPATARFASDVDLLVHGLRADLSRAERVDVEVIGPDGVARVSLEHVPFDRSSGEVLIACQRHYEHVFPPGVDPIFRVHAHEGGARRRVGDYLVHHIWT